MSEDIEAQINEMMDIVNSVGRIKTLSEETGRLYASMLVFDVDKIEKLLVGSFAKNKNVLDSMDENARKRLYDRTALLGCLCRFKLDLEQSTDMARSSKEKYARMNTGEP